MKSLFKAYACDVMGPDQRRFLIPGIRVPGPVESGQEPIKKGDRLRMELADGSSVEVSVLATKFVSFEPKSMPFPIKDGYFYAPEVPGDFRPKGIELGAEVFLAEQKNA